MPRRVIDRGPLFADEGSAQQAASWLQSTGLYERVTVEKSMACKKKPPEDAYLPPPR